MVVVAVNLSSSLIRELLCGLQVYVDLMEVQITAVSGQRKESLGDNWEMFSTVFEDTLPATLRSSVLVSLISCIEWSLNTIASGRGITKQRGILRLAQSLQGNRSPHPFSERLGPLIHIRNVIVHEAGQPLEVIQCGWGRLPMIRHTKKTLDAARKLSPAIICGRGIWIEPGYLSQWTKEALEWLEGLQGISRPPDWETAIKRRAVLG